MPLFRKHLQRLSDERLMACIQHGDTPAFDALYDRYSKRLLYYFYRMLGGDTEKAQDFLQDLFIKIVEDPHLFREGNRFSAWIFTVAHNMCKNEYRRQSVRKAVVNEPDIDTLPQPVDAYHPIEKRLDGRMFLQALLNELAQLNAPQRTTFILRHQENRSIKEISAILNCSEGTVKSRLHYTTRKLAQKLQALHPQQDERPQ